MSQVDEINMEFSEQDDSRAPHPAPLSGSCTVLSSSCPPMTPFKALAQALPLQGLGASESMSQIPVTSSTPPVAGLSRALSADPQVVHRPSTSAGNVHRPDYDGGSDSSEIFPPVSGEPLLATSAPIDIPMTRAAAGRPNGRNGSLGGGTTESRSVPSDGRLKKQLSERDASRGTARQELRPPHRNGVLRMESTHSGEFPRGSRLSVSSAGLGAGRFRPSLVGSSVFGSPLSRRSSASPQGSMQRIYLVTEAMSIMPSFISQFSIDSFAEFEEVVTPREGFSEAPSTHKGFDSTHSYQANLHHLDEPPPDESEGGQNALLQRSMSMPPKYEYKNQTRRKIFSFKDIFPEIGTKDEPVDDREREDEVGELPSVAAPTTPGKRKWQQTMPDLIEGPESETLTSQSSTGKLLAKAALAISRGDYGPGVAKEDVLVAVREEMERKAVCRRYKKNLLVLCLSFFFLFLSYLALRNLQSSLNARDGLGMYAFSSLYGCFFLGCIFATTVVQRLRPKWSMLACMVAIFSFDIVNFYPTFYTLIPVSGVVGFALGIIWTAHATYLTNIAVSYAQLTGERLQDVLVRFNGMHFIFYQLAQITGGLLSSFVLNNTFGGSTAKMISNATDDVVDTTSYSTGSFADHLTDANVWADLARTQSIINATSSLAAACGTAYCPRQSSGGSASSDIDPHMIYMLVGMFTGFSVVGILVMFFFLDRLEGTMRKSHATLGAQLGAVFRFYADRRVVCLVGIMFYSMLQSSFMFGEFTKSFVTCALGVHMVGYVMVCQSAASGISAFVNGRIQKHIGRCPLVVIALLIQFAMLVTLLIWSPIAGEKSIFFVVALFWGLGDGTIVSQTVSMIGAMFSDNKEPAFAALKMTQSIALFAFFMTSQYICTLVKVIAVGVALVMATTGYLVLEGMIYRKQRAVPRVVVVEEIKLDMGVRSAKQV